MIGVAVSRRARTWIREKVGTWWPQVRNTFRSLRGSHKLAQLFLGNIGTEILFATALGLFARGLGFPLSLADLLVINISVSLLATVIPVPGGIGVVEGGLVVGSDVGGRAGVGRIRDGAALPHRDVLPAADLGLVRAPVAAQEPVSVGSCSSRSSHIRASVQVPYTLATRCPNP